MNADKAKLPSDLEIFIPFINYFYVKDQVERELIMENTDILIDFKDSSLNYTHLLKGLVNDPYFEHRDNYFVNKDWISVEVANDFFVEEHNYSILKKLMDIHQEDNFILTYAGFHIGQPFYKLPKNIRINELRDRIGVESNRYACWYFASINGNWAAISEYDDSSLFIGYKKENDLEIRPILMQNNDFVRYLTPQFGGVFNESQKK
jgi:hypothetical protein